MDVDESTEESIKAKMESFEWEISSIEAQKIQIKLSFKDSALFGQDGHEEYIIVKAKFSDFEPGWDDNAELAKSKIPKQDAPPVSPAAQAAIGVAGGSAQVATAATLGVNVALSGAMSQVWGMINGMQLFVNLPLFNVNFPSLSHLIVEDLITIATFDVLPTDEIFEFTLHPDELDQENERFIDVGYDS